MTRQTILAENLTRKYGDVTAVDRVSFDIREHDIVGLLGQNGAGKTTIMKMITGYLEPTGGRVLVDWSLEDRGLLALRSRSGHFARTLVPLGRDRPLLWEYANYVLAFVGLAGVFGIRRYVRRRATRRQGQMLQLQGA